jgi:hypothetical protein
VMSTEPTQTASWADAGDAEPSASMVASDGSIGAEATPKRSAAANQSYDIGAFDLVRGFVEHLVAGNAPGGPGNGRSSGKAVDWETLAASVANSRSLEHAIGRAVVVADQLARGVVEGVQLRDSRTPAPKTDDPFFAFTMADVVPDFGDSRYRSRVARRVGGIIGNS